MKRREFLGTVVAGAGSLLPGCGGGGGSPNAPMMGGPNPAGGSALTQGLPLSPRLFGIGAQILRELNVGQMRLLASPRKIPSMTGFGLTVVGHAALDAPQA